MRAAVQFDSGNGDCEHLRSLMAAGIAVHGVEIARFDDGKPNGDFAVVWGWRKGMRLRAEGFHKPILVMERGYIGDRTFWTSLGWDGLNGRARFTDVSDPERFAEHHSRFFRPWKDIGDYALLVGQVRGDTALIGVDIFSWYNRTAAALVDMGWQVRFRQHPREIERHFDPTPIEGTEYSTSSLEEDLRGAALAVTYSSNTGVNAVMAGVPVHVEDVGSMVYDIASHDLGVVRPDRSGRLDRLAWCQWSRAEIEDGSAWEIVRQSM